LRELLAGAGCRRQGHCRAAGVVAIGGPYSVRRAANKTLVRQRPGQLKL
jgi:hypothetical protein